MPSIRDSRRGNRVRHDRLRVGGLYARNSIQLVCVAGEHCPADPVPDAPVALCAKHLREVYTFAAEMVEQNWDGAVREYVADLHDTFKPPKAVKQPLAGWVYFIQFGDRVKIGYTTKPAQRMQGLPHDRVIGMVPGTRDDEASWHRLLAPHHIVGEWFAAEPEVLAMLERVASAAS